MSLSPCADPVDGTDGTHHGPQGCRGAAVPRGSKVALLAYHGSMATLLPRGRAGGRARGRASFGVLVRWSGRRAIMLGCGSGVVSLGSTSSSPLPETG